MAYYGFGMEGTFTLSMEIGDPVIVQKNGRERIGKVVKKWKNNVVVIEVEAPMVHAGDGWAKDEFKMVKAQKSDEPIKVKFNPDGRGRGDEFWGWGMRFPEQGETQQSIRDKNAGAYWDAMQSSANDINRSRDAAKKRREEQDADKALALKTNAINRSQIAEMATAVEPVKIMNLIGRDGNQRTAIFVANDRKVTVSEDWTASVALLSGDHFARGRVGFSTQYVYANSYDELIDAIILHFWGWT
jgi:hypothetical protein